MCSLEEKRFLLLLLKRTMILSMALSVPLRTFWVDLRRRAETEFVIFQIVRGCYE
jgi:hypothetical protein